MINNYSSASTVISSNPLHKCNQPQLLCSGIAIAESLDSTALTKQFIVSGIDFSQLCISDILIFYGHFADHLQFFSGISMVNLEQKSEKWDQFAQKPTAVLTNTTTFVAWVRFVKMRT